MFPVVDPPFSKFAGLLASTMWATRPKRVTRQTSEYTLNTLQSTIGAPFFSPSETYSWDCPKATSW